MANSFITRKVEFCDATRRNSIELHLSMVVSMYFHFYPEIWQMDSKGILGIYSLNSTRFSLRGLRVWERWGVFEEKSQISS